MNVYQRYQYIMMRKRDFVKAVHKKRTNFILDLLERKQLLLANMKRRRSRLIPDLLDRKELLIAEIKWMRAEILLRCLDRKRMFMEALRKHQSHERTDAPILSRLSDPVSL